MILDPRCQSLEGMADAVAALVRSIAAEEQPTVIGICGYSLGGRIALAIAARHPEIANRIAVISGSPGLQGPWALEYPNTSWTCHMSRQSIASTCCNPHGRCTGQRYRCFPRWFILSTCDCFCNCCPGAGAGEAERARRAERDARLSRGLMSGDGDHFIDRWYRGPLWRQLRAHPKFESIVQQRKATGDA